MIKFFRKIRQNLLSENRFSKYLIYAVGEIVLVVIGILIALQINNWNENRKLKLEEVKLLRVFKSSIEKDTIELHEMISEFKTIELSIDTLLMYLENDLPYNKRLDFHFLNSTANWIPMIDQEVFATLTSSDLNIITNDTLKKEITDYYSFAKRRFDIYINRYANIIENASNELFRTRFNELWNVRKRAMVPNNYEALKKDKEYLYFLRSQRQQLWWLVRDPLYHAHNLAGHLLLSLGKELQNDAKK